jgi:hypothetical protein
VASLASFPSMMRDNRKRDGLRECRAAWLVGVTVREYRELEAGAFAGLRLVGSDLQAVRVVADVPEAGMRCFDG